MYESCSLEACKNQVNGLLGFLHVTTTSLFECQELCHEVNRNLSFG